MFAYFCQWLQNIAFYLVVITAVIQMIPNNSYKKYVRFFTGLLLIVMLTEPFIQAAGMGPVFSELYDSMQYRQSVKQMEEAEKYISRLSLADEPEEQENEYGIWVEEIRIGN